MKNVDGTLGPICNHCGGYGFTNSIGKTSLGCPYCLGSGVDERKVLEARLAGIEDRLARLEQGGRYGNHEGSPTQPEGSGEGRGRDGLIGGDGGALQEPRVRSLRERLTFAAQFCGGEEGEAVEEAIRILDAAEVWAEKVRTLPDWSIIRAGAEQILLDLLPTPAREAV